MNETEATYRQAQMEYTSAVKALISACASQAIPVSIMLAQTRQIEAASDALADAVVALVRAGK